jgi:hypothetical protein
VGKERPARKVTTLPSPVSRFSRKCGNLDVSQPYGPLRPITEKALHYNSRSDKIKTFRVEVRNTKFTSSGLVYLMGSSSISSHNL